MKLRILIKIVNFKVPICNSEGVSCSRRQIPDNDKCLIPCEGVYADITQEKVDIIDINTPGIKKIMEAYENYKNQFIEEMPFPFSISGIT